MHALKNIILNNIKISNTNCWEWQRGKTFGGYGITTINGIRARTHRLSYELFVGKIPKGLHVLHSCDNPACCNPKHLRVGTNYDNVQDRQNKNRQAKGIRHGRHKLSEQDIQEIRKLYATGNYTQQEIADSFGMSRSHICNILKNNYWKHVT